MAFKSVDLPAFGRPKRATTPDLYCGTDFSIQGKIIADLRLKKYYGSNLFGFQTWAGRPPKRLSLFEKSIIALTISFVPAFGRSFEIKASSEFTVSHPKSEVLRSPDVLTTKSAGGTTPSPSRY